MAPRQQGIDRQLEDLADSAGAVMLRDARAVREGLRRVRRLLRDGKPADRSVERLRSLVASSRALRERRRTSIPAPSFPPELPVAEKREEIAAAIRDNQVVVVCGETGSGKTTQLPKICLTLGRGEAGVIGHTQPRRIAARSVAARIAHELGVKPGGLVGHKVRFTDETAPNTLIKLMTDGVLLAETQGDPLLLRYDTIIIDEAHERSLNIDFLLGIIRQILPKRPDLKVIITSATIDPQRFSSHFSDAPIVEVSGRTYPVEVRYRPLPEAQTKAEGWRQGPGPELEEGVLGAIDEACGSGAGDILVFFSGEREIRDMAEALRKRGGKESLDVVPLYARLSADEQGRVFNPGPRRRVVLATNVAETSLTVPRIRYVIDPGYARMGRYSARSRVQRLPIEEVSQASADQRKGRCGRVGPGVCIRLYSEENFGKRPEYTDPEILRTNLAGVILQMKALRLGEIERFPFIDPPDRKLIKDGLDTLHELGALDETGGLTEIGRELARLPLDPRLGRMLIAAHAGGCLREALVVCAALAIQDPRDRPLEKRDEADAAHARFRHEESDFLTLLALWKEFHTQRSALSRSKLHEWCRKNFLSYMRLREWIETQRQLSEIVRELGWTTNAQPAPEADLHKALLTGLLGSVGKKGDGFEYQGPRGVKFAIFPGSGLFSSGPQWLMAGELVQTTRLYAHTVARVQPLWIEKAAAHLVKRAYADAHWQREPGRVIAYETVSLSGLALIERRKVHYGPINPRACRDLFIHHALVDGEIDSVAECLRHNRAMEEEIRRLEAKARRPELLSDPQRRFEFYDRRIPPDIYTAKAFEEWRRRVEESNPTLLYMEREDLLRETPREVTPESHPDELDIDGSRATLDYVFEPGSDADGVTLTAPLSALHGLDQSRLEWLAPGLIEQRIVERIRALPKGVRTNFVPAPNFARRALDGLTPGEPLDEAIARRLESLTGVPIPREKWAAEPLPDHLRVKVRVLDEGGKELASGRDLDALKRSLRSRLERDLAKVPGTPWNKRDLTAWSFGDLPEEVQVETAGASVVGYPALVEEGERVHLQLFPTKERADGAMVGGVRRLFMKQMSGELRYWGERLPHFDRMALHYATIGTAEELRDQILERVVERVFVGDTPPVRTAEAFAQRLDEGWRLVGPAIDEVCRLVDHALAQRQSILMLLEEGRARWPEAAADIARQVDALLAPGWVRDTPWKWLQHVPRYLSAAEERIRRLRAGGVEAARRDAALMADVQRCVAAHDERRRAHEAAGVHDPALETFRWAVEEFRVSQFAQKLGTSMPVSAQRLERLWSEVRP